jgi:hypothetical protein
MQEHVISEGMLRSVEGSGQDLAVIYGFLFLSGADYRAGGNQQALISTISIRSLQGTPIPPGRYQLSASTGESFLLENTGLGWKLAQDRPSSVREKKSPATIRRTLIPVSRASSTRR